MDEEKGCKIVVRSLREDARQWLRAKCYQLPANCQQQENYDEFASTEIEENESHTPEDYLQVVGLVVGGIATEGRSLF